MKSTRSLALMFAFVSSFFAFAHAEGPLRDENAALQYYQAFLTMPADEQLSEKEKKILEDWQIAVFDKNLNELLEKFHDSFRFLHYGVNCKQCQWGQEPSIAKEGLGARQLYLEKARRLGEATFLRARYELSNGEFQKGLDDLLAVLIFARHIGSGGTDIAKLSEYSLEWHVINFTASQLPNVPNKKLLRIVLERLNDLPPSRPLSPGIRADNQMVVTFIRKNGIKAAESLLPAFNIKGVDEDEKKLYRAYLGWKEEDVPRLCQAIEKTFEEAAKLADLPLDRCQAEEKVLRKKLEMEQDTTRPAGINVFLRVIFPPVAKLRFSQARMEVLRPMFRLAITMTIDGNEAIKTVKDPYGNGPFIFRKLEKGFELSSGLKDKDGKPIALIVGPAKQQ